MKLVIAGATGLVGNSFLLEALKASQIQSLTVLVRKKLPEHPKLKQLLIGPDFAAEIPEGAHFVCALGTTIKKAGSREAFRAVDYHMVLSFAHMAKAKNAASFHLVSASGASSRSKVFYNRVKGEVEASVKDIKFPSLTIYRPSLLIGDRAEVRPLEKSAIQLYKVLQGVLPKKIRSQIGTPVALLADRMVMEVLAEKKSGVHIWNAKDIV